MRIFLTLHPSANLSVPGSMIWYKNLYEPLLDLGHDVFLLRMDEFALKNKISFRGGKFKELFGAELRMVFNKEHAKKPFDLFFSYFTDNDISIEAIKEVKKKSIPMANFSCNNTHQFYLVEKISPFFDYNLHSEKDAEIKFKAINANPVWFPMAANPKYYFPQNLDYKYSTSFIGAAYSKRSYYINHLILNNLEVDCFGPNWLINKPYPKLKHLKKELERYINLTRLFFTFDNQGRLNISSRLQYYDLLNNLRDKNKNRFHYPVSDEEMIKIFNQSRINLGFTEVFSTDNIPGQGLKQHLHLREFEVPMSGGLYITNYFEELEYFYNVDKEILTFRNEFELADKIKFYLTHEKEASIIRNNAFKRATSCHSYQNRYGDLFNKIKIFG
jgi:spore maturation protein CgeB